MQFLIPTALIALAATAHATFCGVVTSPVRYDVDSCNVEQYPAMDKACTDAGGHVGGHLQELDGLGANCVTYCNSVPTGNHDTWGDINKMSKYHVYIADDCNSCSYCGGKN